MKVGDKIKAIEDGGSGYKKGEIYTVRCVDPNTYPDGSGPWVGLEGDGLENAEHRQSSFIVVDEVLETHPTGALRESKEGKGLPHLMLAGWPRALMALSRHMDCPLGRERNWEKGLPESSLIDSAFRHILGYISGVSEDSPVYNLTAAAWNIMDLLEEYLRVQDGVMSDEVLDVEKQI